MQPANEDSNNGIRRNRSHILWGQLLNNQCCDTRENGSRTSQNVPHIGVGAV